MSPRPNSSKPFASASASSESLPERVRAFAERHDMFPPETCVVALVSGGADSDALLRLLAGDLLSGGASDEKPKLSVLHVNHLLRGSVADADEAFVEALCDGLGVEFVAVRYDVAAYAAREHLNLEDAGRRIRYSFAEEELDARCEWAGIPRAAGRVATGHTLDDRIETFFMRAITGAGAGGLSSISPVRERIVRPLLACERYDIRTWLRKIDQSWREDETNSDTTRLRALIRQEFVRTAESVNPSFRRTLARTLDLLSDDDALLDEMAEAFSHDFAEVDSEGGRVVFDRASMSTLSRPMARRTIRRALRRAFTEASRLEFAHVEALVDGLAIEGFARDLSQGLSAYNEYGRMVVARGGTTAPCVAPGLLELPGTVDLGDAGAIAASEEALGNFRGSAESVVIDATQVPGPLVVDGVRAGDRMRPLGMEGSRKLSDLLVDAKVSRRDRGNTPVVRNGERIVWLAGVRVSEEYRVTPETRRAVRITWHRRITRVVGNARGDMHRDIERVVLTEEEIRARIAELGDEISETYGDEPILLVAVLRGAALFVADLARDISSPVELDFMAVSSYGSSTKSSGVVRILKDLDETIEERHVLVVEDILDTGLTLKYLLKNLASRSPRTLEVCTLLRKKDKQQVPISCKYVGFDIPDEFVVGYGLDYAEKYRNLPYVGILKPDVYTM